MECEWPSSVAQKPSPCLVWQLTCQVKTHQPHLRIQRFHKEKFQVEIVKCAIKRWLLHPWKGTWQPSTGWSWESRLNVKPVENFSRAKTDLISIQRHTDWKGVGSHFHAPSAITRRDPSTIKPTTQEECTQLGLVWACVWLIAAKKNPKHFWTITNSNSTNRSMQRWLVWSWTATNCFITEFQWNYSRHKFEPWRPGYR